MNTKIRKCPICGEWFSGRADKKYCSQRCCNKALYQKKIARNGRKKAPVKEGRRRHSVYLTDEEWAQVREFIRCINGTQDLSKMDAASHVVAHSKRNVRGVRLKCGKWVAEIGVNRRKIHLGTFETFDDAIKARKTAEQKYFAPVIEAWAKRDEE